MTNYFKIFKLYVYLWICVNVPNTLMGQVGPNTPHTERVLCYSTTTKEVQKLSSTVDYYKIATHELLRTKIITTKKAFQVSLDENDNYITKFRYEYHKNLFPDWHIAPDETIIDNVGVKQVFSTTSTIYKGGWFGHDYQVQKPGAYTSMDLRHGYPEYTYHTDYDQEELRNYLISKQTIIENGLIFPLKFLIPTQKDLIEYQNQGYTVIQNVHWIKVFNRDVTITFYITEKKIVYEFYENYTLIYKIQKFYEWVEEVQQDVIVKEIEIMPYVLTTGDCAESETITTYDDYRYGCDTESTELRQKQTKESITKSLNVFPNPADNVVNLHLNFDINEKDKVEVLVYNQIGSVVLANTSVGSFKNSINIESLSSGVYHVAVQVNNQFYSTTFVKN